MVYCGPQKLPGAPQSGQGQPPLLVLLSVWKHVVLPCTRVNHETETGDKSGTQGQLTLGCEVSLQVL